MRFSSPKERLGSRVRSAGCVSVPAPKSNCPSRLGKVELADATSYRQDPRQSEHQGVRYGKSAPILRPTTSPMSQLSPPVAKKVTADVFSLGIRR